MKTIKHILIDIADNAYIAGLKRDKDSIFNLDQALKELEKLLKECKPKKLRTTWVSEDPHIQQMIDESCADAIDDYEKNIKEVLK